MKACKRVARVLAGVVAVTAVGFVVVALQWVPGSDKILASALDTPIAYERLLNTGQYLDNRLASERRAIQTKQRVAAEVIAGRLTLPQAAALFSEADADLHSYSLRVRMNMLPGNSDAERQCRKVINYVEIELTDETSERDSLLNRLNTELQEELQRNGGTVSLPDSDTVQPRPI